MKGSDKVGGLDFVSILSVPHLSVPVYRLYKPCGNMRHCQHDAVNEQ